MEKYKNLVEAEKARLQQEFNLEEEKLTEQFFASFQKWKENFLDAQEKEISAKVNNLQASADSKCTAKESVARNMPCTQLNGQLTSITC